MPARHARAGDKKSRAEMGEGMGMRCRMKSRLCAVPAAAGFLVVVCLLAALPRTAALARGLIDTGKECSLTVKTEILVQDEEEGDTDWRELNETHIQAYLYRVAYVNQYGEYVGVDGFEGLELEKIDSTVKADGWREKAREAAGILGLPIPPKAEEVNDGYPGDEGSQPGNGQTGNDSRQSGSSQTDTGQPMGNQGQTKEWEPPEDLQDKLAGADAAITLQDGAGTAQGLAQGMYLVWVMPVYTESYQYTFLPYLVSLPNNSYDPSAPVSVDEWDYDPAVGLKPRQDIRYGSLKIQKTLEAYNASLGEAMFVFQVEARKDLDHDGEKEVIYSNVVGLEFGVAGQKEVVIGHIPAGAEVTVEEIYSGSAYTLLGTENVKKTTVIRPEGSGGGPALVGFTNTYDDRTTYGTGAVNRFSYNGNGWFGERITENEGGGSE